MSILEAFDRAAVLSGKKMEYEYFDKNREGDHICYISDLRKMRSHYPAWGLTKSLDMIFEEVCAALLPESWSKYGSTRDVAGASRVFTKASAFSLVSYVLTGIGLGKLKT